MQIPYETTPRKDTGLFNSKLGVWLFLASEVMLFGGLFSAYVFLRVGVRDGYDIPWPWGINVHKTFVLIGFVNTIILILSSVFVVFGWVALKERKWRKFQLYIYATVICAALFMVFKTVEYRSKLTQHHDIRLHDGSMMEGKILDKSYKVPFKADSIQFDLAGGSPGFLYDLKGDFPEMKVEWQEYVNLSEFSALERKKAGEGVEVSKEELAARYKGLLEDSRQEVIYNREATISSAAAMKSWFVKTRTKKKKETTLERKRFREELVIERQARFDGVEFKVALEEAKGVKTELKVPAPVKVALKTVVTPATPLEISARHRRVRPIVRGEDGGKDTLVYSDGCVLKGKGGDDSIKFEPHYVDMQLVPLHLQKDSEMWNVLGDDHAKKMWFKNRDKAYEEMEEYYKDREIPESQLRGYFINLQSLHDKDHEAPFLARFWKEFSAGAGFGGKKHSHEDHGHGDKDHDHAKGEKGHDDHDDKGAKANDHAHEHTAEGDHSHDHDHHMEITVPREKIAFMHSHGPRNSNYYAIYFTITALHGLHVIGGALVLLYFGVFGKKLYKKNPEHLANRVEVGGLFWHFVDLVWIFLFPLMYLL